MPANNDVTFCDPSQRSCYYFRNAAWLNYTNARAACQQLGGELVSYNSGESLHSSTPAHVPASWPAGLDLGFPTSNSWGTRVLPSITTDVYMKRGLHHQLQRLQLSWHH
jgi:hypothetical protein